MSLAYAPPGARGVRLGDKPTVSVVVASGMGLEGLAACLTSLEPQCAQHGAEIVVARAVQPGELRRLAQRHPAVRWVAADPQADALQLRGLGLAAARGDIVALTEDRSVVGPNWLGQLLEGTRHSDGGGAMGGVPQDGAGDWAAYFAEPQRFSGARDQAASPDLTWAS